MNASLYGRWRLFPAGGTEIAAGTATAAEGPACPELSGWGTAAVFLALRPFENGMLNGGTGKDPFCIAWMKNGSKTAAAVRKRIKNSGENGERARHYLPGACAAGSLRSRTPIWEGNAIRCRLRATGTECVRLREDRIICGAALNSSGGAWGGHLRLVFVSTDSDRPRFPTSPDSVHRPILVQPSHKLPKPSARIHRHSKHRLAGI